MKKSNFTDNQIIGIVAEVETGRKIADICREHGITQATFYNWRKKYAGMQPNQLRRLKELESELSQFKRMYADIGLRRACILFCLSTTVYYYSARRRPEQIHVDNGSEFVVQAMSQLREDNDIDLLYIQKGKPCQNAYVERFNRTYREEVLDAYAFDSLRLAREITQAWMWMYSNESPHSALGYLPPSVFLNRRNGLADFPTLQMDNEIYAKYQTTTVAI